MPTRHVCQKCQLSFRKGRECDKCAGQLYVMNLDHTTYGMLMYAFAVIFLAMVFFSFAKGDGIIFLVSLVFVGVAIGMNVADDAAIDAEARRRLGR